jgi:hypothetical protein
MLRPACRMIERSVPGLRSRLAWTGTVTVRVESAGKCHDMMAADDTIDDKPRFLESANNVFAAGDR